MYNCRTNSRNTIGRNPTMVIPLLASQDLRPMLIEKQRGRPYDEVENTKCAFLQAILIYEDAFKIRMNINKWLKLELCNLKF